MRFPAEPFCIKVVEPLRRVSREERERLIQEAGLTDTVIQLHRGRRRLKGLRITYEAPVLRHFTARLEEIEKPRPAVAAEAS
jgi:tryptophanase